MNMLILTNTQFLIYSLINNINYIIEIIIISLGVILLSSVGRAVYEHGHRVLTGTAASISIYNKAKSMLDSGGDPEDENKDENKKDENKKDDNKSGENKSDENKNDENKGSSK